MIIQGGLKSVDSTAETDRKAHDDLTTFAKSALFQLIRIN